jgi:beta-galactosidase
MDVFRLPKFSYYFYRSQRGPAEGAENWQGGPMVFVASHWTATSELRVLVFSNCEEVELRLNGALIGREKPARTWMTQFLPHPPFVFQLPSYVPGELRATGFLRNAAAAVHSVKTPGAATSLHLEVEDGACTYASNTGFDLRFAHARLVDDDGTLCVQEKSVVKFALEGAVEFVGPAVVEAEAGIASVLLRVAAGSPRFSLTARAEHSKRVLSAVYRADAQLAAAPRRAVSAPTAV